MSRERNVKALAALFAKHLVSYDGDCSCGAELPVSPDFEHRITLFDWRNRHLAETAAAAGIGSAGALTDEELHFIAGLGLPAVRTCRSADEMRILLARAFGRSDD